MKKLIVTIALAATCLAGYSQTNESPTLIGALQNIGASFSSAVATNFGVAPYLTYAPKAPEKFGGGVLALWNFNQNVGVGMGLDWLGHWSQVSANIQLKLPVHPLTFLGMGSFTSNFTVTPFGLGGVALPIASANASDGSLASIAGAGASVSLAKLWGGDIGLGGAWVNWSNAGQYSGDHYEGFIYWKKGF